MNTRYHNLSDAELLRLCYEKREHSPIIEELCKRLESKKDECPVCEADLSEV